MTVLVNTPGQSVSVDRQPDRHMSQALEASRRRRRLGLAEALQPLDPRPSRGSSAPAERDERCELGASELGNVGRDRLTRE